MKNNCEEREREAKKKTRFGIFLVNFCSIRNFFLFVFLFFFYNFRSNAQIILIYDTFKTFVLFFSKSLLPAESNSRSILKVILDPQFLSAEIISKLPCNYYIKKKNKLKM